MTVSGKNALLVLLAASGAGVFMALAFSPGLPTPGDAMTAMNSQIVYVSIEPAKAE